jgi:hypothetical protein
MCHWDRPHLARHETVRTAVSGWAVEVADASVRSVFAVLAVYVESSREHGITA